MIFNKTFVFTSVGFILLFIIYNTKKPLNTHNYDKSNMSILDDILHSEHKYESSDCLKKKFHCTTDKECLDVCDYKGLPWICLENQCAVNTDIIKPVCIFGKLTAIYDSTRNEIKYKCVCSLLHYGDDCSKTIHFCDAVKENKCLCNSDSVLFKYYDDFDVCIPLIHRVLFSRQDNFKQK